MNVRVFTIGQCCRIAPLRFAALSGSHVREPISETRDGVVHLCGEKVA